MNAPATPKAQQLPDSWFGRRPPQGVTVLAAYGARAILSGGRPNIQHVDFLPDRQQAFLADSDDERMRMDLPPDFLAFARDKVLPWAKGLCGERWIDPGGTKVFTLRDGQMVAEACPQASYGYLYIGAWMLPPETG